MGMPRSRRIQWWRIILLPSFLGRKEKNWSSSVADQWFLLKFNRDTAGVCGLMIRWHLQEVRKIILALFLLKGATYGGMHESPSSVPPLIWICRTMYGAVPNRLTRCARYCGSDVWQLLPKLCISLILSSSAFLIFWSLIRCGYVLLRRNRLLLFADWQGIGLVTVISRTLWFPFLLMNIVLTD